MEKTRMSTPTEAVMHPLVLLSVVDHFTRLSGAALPNRRVVGILLGTSSKGTVDVTNSFAVPFDEDPRSPNVLYFDHNYVESMYAMFRKVNARERIVGWYSSGPKIRSNDLDVHQILRGYAEHPVYCIVEVQPKDDALPCTSYIVKEETEDEASQPKLVFQHILSRIGALEAEEIGVEHLLRDVSDTTVGTLSTQIRGKVTALQGLSERITEIVNYLQTVVDGKLPLNHNIMYKLQDMLNLLPHLQHQHSQKEVAIQSNDDFMTMYVASVVRNVLALHNLVINKRQLRQAKIDLEKKKKDEAEKKEKEEKEKKEKEEKEKLEKEEKEEKERKEKEDKEKEGAAAPEGDKKE